MINIYIYIIIYIYSYIYIYRIGCLQPWFAKNIRARLSIPWLRPEEGSLSGGYSEGHGLMIPAIYIKRGQNMSKDKINYGFMMGIWWNLKIHYSKSIISLQWIHYHHISIINPIIHYKVGTNSKRTYLGRVPCSFAVASCLCAPSLRRRWWFFPMARKLRPEALREVTL